MERHEFLAKLGMGMAAVCAGCSIISCGSKVNDPTPGGDGGDPPPTSDGSLFSVDINNELKTVGSSKVTDGVIVVRLAAETIASSFAAVQVACTHQGTSINYNTNQGIFICPNHGSEFSTSGAVLLGPAATSLKKYNVAVEGTNLIVSA
jgi:cytochrome b6-f complex iron-sulfur subunit